MRSLPTPNPSRQLVISDSVVRADKDRKDREKGIARWRKRLAKSKNPKARLKTRGFAKFLHIQGQATVQVNEQAVAHDARWDGLHGVITNLPTATHEQTILERYRGLWQTEETFRVSKHDLKVRPIFHWTAKRIQAHLAIAFMSLLCVRHLQYRMALQQGQRVSPQVICNALTHVQYSVLADTGNGRRYAIPSLVCKVAETLYRVVGKRHNPEPFEIKKSA